MDQGELFKKPVVSVASAAPWGPPSLSPEQGNPFITGGATNTYGVILADPPWCWKSWSEQGEGRSAKKYYDLMESDDLYNFPVADVASNDCVLFMWCINSMLPDAIQLIDAWGFRFKTVGYVWIKTNRKARSLFMGLGYHTRQNAELCLLATKGKPKRQAGDVHQIIMSPRREHSRKPDEIYGRIERLYPGPYLELFSRTKRAGWDQWGNETGRWSA